MLTTCVNLRVGTFWDSNDRLARLKQQVVVSESYVLQHADLDDEALVPPPIMPPR